MVNVTVLQQGRLNYLLPEGQGQKKLSGSLFPLSHEVQEGPLAF